MKVLLVYPEAPTSFWSFTHALKFILKKANTPPLGLLTIASLLPANWEKQLVDMNVSKLKDKDIKSADYVMISAMVIQKESARKVIDRCKTLGVKTVAGGPLFTFEHELFQDVDHLLLYEGEVTVPQFLADLKKGTPQPVYVGNDWTDLTKSPEPAWKLVNMRHYATLNLQYSRGCPFHCDFCNVTTLFGHIPRTKTAAQVIGELDSIYRNGWRGEVFFVDDNFIGNRKKLKTEVLPAMIQWMEEKKYPFSFLTEVSVNLADDDELMDLMVKAGFRAVFVGIETVSEESLAECNKVQNRNRDMSASVKKMHHHGLAVYGGFIVGFDSDNESIFERMIRFIQDNGIVTAMVGLLSAPKGTKLYDRLEKEGRITKEFTGSNTDYSMNFRPKMNFDALIDGYKKIIETIYSPKHYYERVMNFLQDFRPADYVNPRLTINDIVAFFKANIKLGIFGSERRYYWKLVWWSIKKKPGSLALAVRLAIYGYHFRKVFAIGTV